MIPVHYEGWKHFREGRAAAARAFAEAGAPEPTWAGDRPEGDGHRLRAPQPSSRSSSCNSASSAAPPPWGASTPGGSSTCRSASWSSAAVPRSSTQPNSVPAAGALGVDEVQVPAGDLHPLQRAGKAKAHHGAPDAGQVGHALLGHHVGQAAASSGVWRGTERTRIEAKLPSMCTAALSSRPPRRRPGGRSARRSPAGLPAPHGGRGRTG